LAYEKIYKMKITMDDEKIIHIKEIQEKKLKEFKKKLLKDEERLIDISVYSPEYHWIVNTENISYIEINEIATSIIQKINDTEMK